MLKLRMSHHLNLRNHSAIVDCFPEIENIASLNTIQQIEQYVISNMSNMLIATATAT